jgi:hypothetical protein
MWPEQQPPGGEQNAQNGQPNPYQQPGEPNPYQQPQQPAPQPGGYGYPQQTPSAEGGYGYPQQPPAPPANPNPYGGGYGPQPGQDGQYGYQQPAPGGQFGYPQPPTVESWGYQQPEPPKRRNTTTMIAIGAAVAVVVAASVTAGIVMNKDDGKDDRADVKPSAAPSSSAPSSPAANPRAGGDTPPQVPGWKVVVNPKYGVAFDVPPEWKVDSPGTSRGFSDAKKNDGMPVVSMSGTATWKEEWCTIDSDKNGYPEKTSLADAGTKGGQGAKNTAEAARNEAGNWVWAGFAQKEPKGTVKVSKARPYTTASGLTGHVATANANGVKKTDRCDTDGKGLAFSFKTAKGDFASFVLFGPNNVKDEIAPAVYKKILSSVRLTAQ